MAVVQGKAGPASGYPVGKQDYGFFDNGIAYFDAVNPYEAIQLTITAPFTSQERGMARRPDDFTKDAAWVESIVRQAMNNYAGAA